MVLRWVLDEPYSSESLVPIVPMPEFSAVVGLTEMPLIAYDKYTISKK